MPVRKESKSFTQGRKDAKNRREGFLVLEEEVELSEHRDFGDARRQLGRFLEDVYNRARLHSSLDYLTPAEFEQQWGEVKSSRAKGPEAHFGSS